VSAGLVDLIGATGRSVEYFLSEDELICKHIAALEAQVMYNRIVTLSLTGNDITEECLRSCIRSPNSK
jgi:hypothetical protein